MNKFVLRQSLLLLLTATIWGVAFVAQSVGMDYVDLFTFNVMRSIIGGVVLLPCIALLGKINGKGNTEAAKKMDGKERKTLFIGGIACGVLLCIASNLQSSLGSCIHLSEKQDLSQQCTLWLFRYLGFFLGKKVSGKSLVWRWDRGSRIISFMHDREWIFCSERRFSVDALRTGIFLTHFSH